MIALIIFIVQSVLRVRKDKKIQSFIFLFSFSLKLLQSRYITIRNLLFRISDFQIIYIYIEREREREREREAGKNLPSNLRDRG